MRWGSVAIWLRVVWAAAIGVLAAASILVVLASGLSPGVVLAADIGVFLVGILCLVALGYAVSHAHAFTPPAELATSATRVVIAVFTEYMAILALYVAIEPFERWWMGCDAIGRLPPGRVPVLFVHAYLSNRGQWWWLRRGLRRHGVAVATVNLEPPLQSIDRFTEQLDQRIEAVLAETGAQRLVLVGHSMGGLVARNYLQRHGAGRVAELITIGTPHHGSWFAFVARGQCAREMQPGGAWLGRLSAQTPPVPTLTVWSARDNFIAPQDSATLPGAREHVLPVTGHLSMMFSSTVFAILLREVGTYDAGGSTS